MIEFEEMNSWHRNSSELFVKHITQNKTLAFHSESLKNRFNIKFCLLYSYKKKKNINSGNNRAIRVGEQTIFFRHSDRTKRTKARK